MATPPLKAKLIVGWREWVALPELPVPAIKAKLDTGARTSALHAFQIRVRDGWAEFDVHPLQRDDTHVQRCRARIIDRRQVTDSGGHRERRYVVQTPLQVGAFTWPIEVTLTNRDEMGFRMLLGREALRPHLVIDPGLSFQLGKPRNVRRRPRPHAEGGRP